MLLKRRRRMAPQGFFFFFCTELWLLLTGKVIFVWVTDYFQVTYSTAWEDKGSMAVYDFLRADRQRKEYLVTIFMPLNSLKFIYIFSSFSEYPYFLPYYLFHKLPSLHQRGGKNKLNHVPSVLTNKEISLQHQMWNIFWLLWKIMTNWRITDGFTMALFIWIKDYGNSW